MKSYITVRDVNNDVTIYVKDKSILKGETVRKKLRSSLFKYHISF